MKNYKIKKWGGSLRYIIPSIIGVLLIVIILGNKFLPRQLLGSVYSIEELEEKIDKVKVGDTIDYEINGYNNWEVLYTDKGNGTIDVVSKTNTEDLALEPNQEKSYYENKLQEAANKYTDNKYAVSARSVNQADLDYFVYDIDFWLNNVNKNTITTSMSSWTYKIKNYKMYVIPYIVIPEENTSNYNEGDKYTYSDNGVDRWVVVEHGYVAEEGKGACLVLIPETPIELVIDDVNTNIGQKANEIINSFNQAGVWEVGNYDSRYDMYNLPNLIGTFLNQQTERIWLYFYQCCYQNSQDEILSGYCASPYYYNEASDSIQREYNISIYKASNPKTKGFRPVVTLEVSKAKEGKELTSKLKVGDNVKYSAKDYNNWRVLSIDEDAGTVDIISGGIVKNITLTGKDDYDNLEDILQKEVDAYKNGENVVSARAIEIQDLANAKDKTKNYWVNAKKKDKLNVLYYSNWAYIQADALTVAVGTYDNIDGITKKSVPLYVNYSNTIAEQYLGSSGNQSYTAGLRPVITLKLDSIEKLSDSETKQVESTTQKLDKVIYKEQTTKNKNYNESKLSNIDDTSSKGTDTTGSVESNENITNNYVTKTTTKPKLLDYVVIILLIINTIIALLTLIKVYKK